MAEAGEGGGGPRDDAYDAIVIGSGVEAEAAISLRQKHGALMTLEPV